MAGIRFPANALGTQSLISLLPDRVLKQDVAIEVRICEVLPVVLDTVFVSIDHDAISKMEEVIKRYGGGFTAARGGRKAVEQRASSEKDENARKKLVDEALQNAKVVHTGDMLPLNLSHPITHASAPPAKVLACEPVAQGILGPTTKVVITSTRQAASHRRAVMSPPPQLLPEEQDERDDAEDTSNEAFFSAAESSPYRHSHGSHSPAKPIVTSKSTTDLSNTDDLFNDTSSDSNEELSGSNSDSDDMIALASPSTLLPTLSSGYSSVKSSATQRPFGNLTNFKLNGNGNGITTPGSVYSHFSTTSTLRGAGNRNKSKVFRAQGLLRTVPTQYLHPAPTSEDDEEARIYVEAAQLARLGVFSGDWVRVEAAVTADPLAAFAGGVKAEWRPVKVYSLPEYLAPKAVRPRYQINGRGTRRESISSVTTMSGAATATLWLSPLLLHNLGGPASLSLSPLVFPRPPSAGVKRPQPHRPTSSTSTVPKAPPVASELTLRKVLSPLSSERALDAAVYAGLKGWLEQRRRVLRTGDLLSVGVDEKAGRACAGSDDHGVSPPGGRPTGVAWFLVENVKTRESATLEDDWNGTVTISPRSTTTRQSGDVIRAIPSTGANTWPHYIGIRPPPPGSVLTPAVPSAKSPLHTRLRTLISTALSPRAQALGLPPLALLLHSTHRHIGKRHLIRSVCEELGVHFFCIDAFDIASESAGGGSLDAQALGVLSARLARGAGCGGSVTVVCILHVEILGGGEKVAAVLKALLCADDTGSAGLRCLVATSTDVEKVEEGVRKVFTQEVEMSAPGEGEREGILREALGACAGVQVTEDVDLRSVAVKTAALVAGDLVEVVQRAIIARTERLETLANETHTTIRDLIIASGPSLQRLTPTDFDHAVDHARATFASSIGAPKIPNVQWSDVGGLSNVKDAVIETIQLPLSRPDLFASGLKKRSGILFYGPPGTGKTLLAKAIATEFSLNFFSVKGPELLNMYIGESEANVRRVFQRARDARPCVVFFDELDSVAPKRGNQGDSGGVMDRIVSQLLAELDGMSGDGGEGVFVVGATNRPDLLDQALLRPGRFDKMLYLGISDTSAKQAKVLEALTRKFDLDPGVSLARVAETLPFTYTGADLYALCADAMLKAVTRSARLVDGKLAIVNTTRERKGQGKVSTAYWFDHFATKEDLEVVVCEEDFDAARAELVPSVSFEELGHYEKVRDMFEGQAKGEKTEAVKEPKAVQGPQQPMSRAQLREILKRAPSTQRKVPTLTSNGSAAQHGNGHAGDSDADEDYVVRTDRLALNGGAVRPPSSNGYGRDKLKGKGQIAVAVQGGDEEDLYD